MHLVTIRIWQEEIESGVHQWRGSIRNGINGEVQHFAGLSSLADVTLADLITPVVNGELDENDFSEKRNVSSQ